MTEREGFGIWVTGLPASGKSSLTRELAGILRERNVPLVVFESDELRKILTPQPGYSEQERDRFYHQVALLGSLVKDSGVNVIFDATANKRIYRESARNLFSRFLEVYVKCPLEICIMRDPKGIYAEAGRSRTGTVPGVQAGYEPPKTPDLVVNCETPSKENAEKIVHYLAQKLYI